MTPLTIRQLDDETLRRRADELCLSVEEAAAQIIREALSGSESVATIAQQLFGQTNGVELEQPAKRPHEPAIL